MLIHSHFAKKLLEWYNQHYVEDEPISKNSQKFGRRKKGKAKSCYPYRSMLEKDVANQLAHLEFSYETEDLPYVLEKKYKIDFKIGEMYIEVKGRLTQSDRAKYIAVKKAHPEIDLRFLFGANNKIGTNPQYRYTDWADKNGFKSAIKKVPKEWLRN